MVRKFLIVAIAAFVAVAFAGVSSAQDPGATMEVEVTPKKAGKKSKPRASTIQLDVINEDFTQTASRIEIWLPKAMKVSTRGIKKCSLDALSASGTSGCKPASKIGSGEAQARAGVSRAGVYNANPGVLPFKVTAYAADPDSEDQFLRDADLAFYLQQMDKPGDEGGKVVSAGIVAVAPARLGSASGKYGSRLTIEIPEEPAQQYPLGAYNGLEELHAELFKKVGRRSLLTTNGCKRGKHPFQLEVTFVPNPAPPTVETVGAKDNAACR